MDGYTMAIVAMALGCFIFVGLILMVVQDIIRARNIQELDFRPRRRPLLQDEEEQQNLVKLQEWRPLNNVMFGRIEDK